jgi:hypothetical protein
MKGPGGGAGESYDLVIKSAGENLTITSSNHPYAKTMKGTGTLKGDVITMALKPTWQDMFQLNIVGKVAGNKITGAAETCIFCPKGCSFLCGSGSGDEIGGANDRGPNGQVPLTAADIPKDFTAAYVPDTSAAPTDSISGKWAIKMKGPGGRDESFDLVIKAAGENLTITCDNNNYFKTAMGTLKGDAIAIKFDMGDPSASFTMSGKVAGNKITGTREFCIPCPRECRNSCPDPGDATSGLPSTTLTAEKK